VLTSDEGLLLKVDVATVSRRRVSFGIFICVLFMIRFCNLVLVNLVLQGRYIHKLMHRMKPATKLAFKRCVNCVLLKENFGRIGSWLGECVSSRPLKIFGKFKILLPRKYWIEAKIQCRRYCQYTSLK
jgi:hypothetical protein